MGLRARVPWVPAYVSCGGIHKYNLNAGLRSVPEVVFIDKLADLRSVQVGGGAEGAGPLGSSLRFLRWDSLRHFKSGLEISSLGGIHG